MNEEYPSEEKMNDAVKTDEGDCIDPDEAFARAVEALTSEKKIKMMGYLKNDKEAHKIWLMYAMSRREGLEFLQQIAVDRLQIWTSTDKGHRAVLLVKALQSLNGQNEEKVGLTDRIRDFVKRE